uniref:MFS-type transporter SLC18B1 n=1 Tax=Cacopsylla melanoneura TaxID=428564 RepID=A0A8D8VZN9_9HEMI
MPEESFTTRQWLTLIAIGSVHFSSSICISLQAPFYPAEAEKKGATATEYGLVFGSFELVAFLSSPLFGRYIHTIGTRCLLSLGLVVNAVTAIMFGFLDYVQMHDSFIFFSFVIRILESLGATAALIAAFSLTAACFPESMATTFATLEVFYGLGYIVGPTIGGFLFSVGGFKLPFFVIGIATLVIAVVVSAFIPAVEATHDENDGQTKISKILKVSAVLLDSISICAASSSMGFYTAVLEPHLREFNISPVAVGFMFIISGGTYACWAPFVGRICDKYANPKKIIIIGCLLITLSFVLVGPLPYSGIPKTLYICILGLVIHGLGLGCIMVPTFIDALRSAIEAGFPDDLSTYGMLSGLWSSSFALGAFVGPSVAGFLFDTVGFQYGTLFPIVCHMLLFVVLVIFVYKKSPRKMYTKLSEDTHLLSKRKYTNEILRQNAVNGKSNGVVRNGVLRNGGLDSLGVDKGSLSNSATDLVFGNSNFPEFPIPRMPRRFNSERRTVSESHSGPGYEPL